MKKILNQFTIQSFLQLVLLLGLSTSATIAKAQNFEFYKKSVGFHLLNQQISSSFKMAVIYTENKGWHKSFLQSLLQINPDQVYWIKAATVKEYPAAIEQVRILNPKVIVSLHTYKNEPYRQKIQNLTQNSIWIQALNGEEFNQFNYFQVGAYDVNERKAPTAFAWGTSIINYNGEIISGSQVVALSAGAVTAVLMQNPRMNSDLLIEKMYSRQFDWNSTGLSINDLLFGWTGPQCFEAVNFSNLSEGIQAMIFRGAKLVKTSAGLRLITPFDPIQFFNIGRIQYDDMLTVSPRGMELFQRRSPIPNDAVEIFQRPIEASICNNPPSFNGHFFEIKRR